MGEAILLLFANFHRPKRFVKLKKGRHILKDGTLMRQSIKKSITEFEKNLKKWR